MTDVLKPRTPAFDAFKARVTALLSVGVLAELVADALERPRLERIALRFQLISAAELARLPLAVVARRYVEWSAAHDDGTFELVRELDRASQGERALVDAVPSEGLAERVGSPRELRLRRHGARLVWALLRDGRAASAEPVAALVLAYAEETARLLAVRAALEERGATAELALVDELWAHATDLEEARRALASQVAERERDLVAERAARERLAAEVGRTLPVEASEPAVARPALARPDAAALEQRLRKLEKRLAATERERDDLRSSAEAAPGLRSENAQLREQVEKLREVRAAELRALEKARSGPAVEPPRQHLAREAAPAPKPGVSRVGIFLDVANLSGAARRLYDGASVDFRKLMTVLKGSRELGVARAYAIDKGGDGFAAFARALREAGYQVMGKRPKTFPDGTMKADWDVGIVVDVLRAADKLDVVVLGSGDGDFTPLAAALKQRGVRLEVAGFGERTASDLVRVADDYLDLDESVLER